jgi:biopolymer transport protein ExbD
MALESRNKIKAEGGIASMTDLVFLLLIFFIIMSLMSNNQTPIDLPKPNDDIKPVQDPVEATVIITEDNKYFVHARRNRSASKRV